MKNILLIGGSYGIGFALAELLADECNVIIASRTFEAGHPNIKHLKFDASTDQLDAATLPEVIDGLVYCPGSINLRPFKTLKIENFLADLQINFIDMVKVVQSVMPQLTSSGKSSIVLFSSVAASIGMPYHSSIAAAKGAVEGFGKALAAEFAPHLRVNIIAPSITKTPLADKFLNSDSKQEKSSALHPLKRFGEPSDIAQMAAFLLSDNSSWITGQVFHVDGGLSTIQTH